MGLTGRVQIRGRSRAGRRSSYGPPVLRSQPTYTQRAVGPRPGGSPAHLTTKERILLHLLDYVKYPESVEVPPEMTQEGLARAAGIEIRHLTQYLRPLLREKLVSERTAHVTGGKQRRKVYDLTTSGRMTAIRLRDEVRDQIVRVRDVTGIREATVSAVLATAEGRVRLVDIVREASEAGVVDLAAAREARGLVEMCLEAPRPRAFVGRQAELDVLLAGDEGPRTFVVRGVAGIGKSSLAAKACERLRGTRNLFWHRIRPWDTRGSLLAAVAEFLGSLGKPGLRSVLLRDRMDWADAALRSDLPGTRAFLVFDDAHEAQSEVLAFLRFLKEVVAEAPGMRLLVLTRRALAFYDRRDVTIHGTVREVDLAGLTSEDIAALLSPGEDSRALVELGRRLGGHPLLLELARATAPGLPAPAMKDVRRFIEEEIYASLSDEERRVMKAASLVRMPVPRSSLVELSAGSHDAVVSLEAHALLRSVGEDAVGVHDTIREFFASVLSPAEREVLARDAVVELRRLADRAAGRRDFVAAVHYLSNALRLDPAPEEEAALWEALGDVDERIGDLPGALTAYKSSAKIAADAHMRARLHRKTATALQVRGHSAPAMREVEAGFRALGDAPSPERGWLHLVRTRAAEAQEDWAEAREDAEAALDIFRGFGDVAGQAQALLESGQVEFAAPSVDPSAAERYLAAALEASSAVPEPEFLARVHIALAHLFANRFGDAARAERHIEAFRTLAPSVSDPHVQRSFLMLQGWFNLEIRADFAAAEDAFLEAMALGRRIHDASTIAFARYGIAHVRCFQGRVEESRGMFETLAREIDAQGFPGYAVESRWMVLECALREGDLAGARAVLETFSRPDVAKALRARPVHEKLAEGLGRCLGRDPEGARAAFDEALRQTRGVAVVEEASLAQLAHFHYAVALRGTGHDAEAEDHLREARTILERFGLRARLAALPDAERAMSATLRRAISGA